MSFSIRPAILVFALGACATGSVSAGGTTSADEAEHQAARPAIARATAEFGEALKTGDPAAVAGWYTEDALLMDQGMADVRGRAAIQAFYTSRFAARKITDVSITTREREIHDTSAYESGIYSQTLQTSDGASTRVEGRYMAVLRQQADGSWKIHRLMLSRTTP